MGRRLFVIAATVAIGAAWFAWLRPVALGGDASYVVVQGGSMQPTYDDGDLILIRAASQYETGDIIAFRAGGEFDDPTRIIHRIVGEWDDGSFKTQGDNRDQLDPWQPTSEDIIGKANLHIPLAGRAAGVGAPSPNLRRADPCRIRSRDSHSWLRPARVSTGLPEPAG